MKKPEIREIRRVKFEETVDAIVAEVKALPPELPHQRRGLGPGDGVGGVLSPDAVGVTPSSPTPTRRRSA